MAGSCREREREREVSVRNLNLNWNCIQSSHRPQYTVNWREVVEYLCVEYGEKKMRTIMALCVCERERW